MSNALAQVPAPERFANPVKQLTGLLGQPAVRRSLPMILMLGLIASAALAWMMLATPTQKTLFANLPDADKGAVTAALTAANIKSHIDEATGSLTVAEEDYSRARILLAGQGLPKTAPTGYQVLDQLPMGVSRAVEGERLRQARETELAQSIQEIDAVSEARVHLAMPENTVFVRDNAAPSASVILKLAPGRSLSDAQVASIVNLVASSVPGMKPDSVTIVDQMGKLLSHPGGSDDATAATDARIDFQRKMEAKYQEQLTQLLTPLVGAGNFSAQVQADVDLDETQATRESYDKQGALKAEQGNWTADKAGAQPGGVPGSLSNQAPPASTITAPKQAAGNPGAPAGANGASTSQPTGGANGPADSAKQSDSYARAFDLGKEVSVTRASPGKVKRLSVAVVLRDPETGRPRNAVELQQVTDLVRAAVGYDASRNDQVTVISRRFAATANGAAGDSAKAAWYDAAWVPVVARNVTALVIALLVLMLGVRPLAKALMKRRDDVPTAQPAFQPAPIAFDQDSGQPVPAPPRRPSISIEMLEQTRGYDDRIAMVQGFTRENPTRAALAVRDMIKTDAR
ncbi:MAG: flagellar basal-body MS-ring/collar protein FliF [Sphingomonas sp.]